MGEMESVECGCSALPPPFALVEVSAPFLQRTRILILESFRLQISGYNDKEVQCAQPMDKYLANFGNDCSDR